MSPVQDYDQRETRVKFVLSEIADLMKGDHNPDDPAYFMWAILTALRGPDMEETRMSDLKKATTTKIRAVLGIPPYPHNISGVDSAREKPLTLPRFLDAVGNIPGAATSSFHFASHYNEAVRALRKLNLLGTSLPPNDF